MQPQLRLSRGGARAYVTRASCCLGGSEARVRFQRQLVWNLYAEQTSLGRSTFTSNTRRTARCTRVNSSAVASDVKGRRPRATATSDGCFKSTRFRRLRERSERIKPRKNAPRRNAPSVYHPWTKTINRERVSIGAFERSL